MKSRELNISQIQNYYFKGPFTDCEELFSFVWFDIFCVLKSFDIFVRDVVMLCVAGCWSYCDE